MNASSSNPRALVAVLGASNVTLALPQILTAMHRRTVGRGPVEFYVAHGPGRSYGTVAGLPWVEFPALRSCGLFETLESRWRSTDRPAVYAMLTDVGNDIMYGVSPRRIAAWVGEIVQRFQTVDARVVLTSIPVESVLRIPAWKFNVVRRILFPSYPMLRRDVFTRTVQVEAALETLGRDLSIDVLPTQAEWYSVDHIHIARRHRARVFGGWADALFADGADRPPSASEGEAVTLSMSTTRLRLLRPAELFVAGRRWTRRQTGVEIAAGARLFLY